MYFCPRVGEQKVTSAEDVWYCASVGCEYIVLCYMFMMETLLNWMLMSVDAPSCVFGVKITCSFIMFPSSGVPNIVHDTREANNIFF